MSSLNCYRQQFIKFRGTLQIATGTVQEGGWVGQTCRGHWSPVVAHAALYQATG